MAEAVAALARATHPDLRAGARRIAVGDEAALTAAELASCRNAVTTVRRASGAARRIARTLLGDLGADSLDLPKAPSGAPRWPGGFVGSLSHDDTFAVAAVAPARRIRGVGVDVEPADPLPADLVDLVTTATERRRIAGAGPVAARLLFCIKEAVFKATHPLDGVFLEHHDVEVCLASARARTSSGRTLEFRAVTRPRLLVMAVLTA